MCYKSKLSFDMLYVKFFYKTKLNSFPFLELTFTIKTHIGLTQQSNSELRSSIIYIDLIHN